MRIRTRMHLSFMLFAFIILMTAFFLANTFIEVDRVNRQETIARSIEQTARELSYLSNDYLLNRDEPQRTRWEAKFASLSEDLRQLSLTEPRQRLLAEQIQTHSDHLQSVFTDISSKIQAGSTDPGSQVDTLDFVQVSWSRLEVQNQNIVFNASLLVQSLLSQREQTRQTSILLLYGFAFIFAGYLLTNYFFIYRRVLQALDKLQLGTRIIGTGNLMYQIEDPQADEFGVLSRAFNQMTRNLRDITASKVDLEREIAERQLAEEALRASEARLRRLVEADIIGVFTRDRLGLVKDANAVFLNLVGATPQDLQRGELNILDLVPDAERRQEAGWMDAWFSDPVQPREKMYQRKDGRLVPVLVGETQINNGKSPEWIGFVLDLTELKKAQAALAEYAEKLQSSNQELEQFAFIASHDLKEPMRKIRSFGDLLVKRLGDRLEEEPRDLLMRMQNAAERMQEMIDDLLELSRVGRRGKPFAAVSLLEVAEEVLSDLELRIGAVGGKVEIQSLPVVESDPLQMHQLLQNLLGNAIKYHRPGVPPQVEIWCQEEMRLNGKVVTLFVRDNGIGFNEEYLEKIFQPFTRLHGRDAYEGTGMGLAICKKIVERHQGQITAHSTPGEGSTFMVTLPVKQS